MLGKTWDFKSDWALSGVGFPSQLHLFPAGWLWVWAGTHLASVPWENYISRSWWAVSTEIVYVKALQHSVNDAYYDHNPGEFGEIT